MSKATERRLAQLEQALAPSPLSRPIMIVAADLEEADRRLAVLAAAAEPVSHPPLLILTGVPRALGSIYA